MCVCVFPKGRRKKTVMSVNEGGQKVFFLEVEYSDHMIVKIHGGAFSKLHGLDNSYVHIKKIRFFLPVRVGQTNKAERGWRLK